MSPAKMVVDKYDLKCNLNFDHIVAEYSKTVKCLCDNLIIYYHFSTSI